MSVCARKSMGVYMHLKFGQVQNSKNSGRSSIVSGNIMFFVSLFVCVREREESVRRYSLNMRE